MFALVFMKRPFGFGIMSPLGTGVMVSSVQDKTLLDKEMMPGTPILAVENFDVRESTLATVARLMSSVKLPMSLTLGRVKYFKPNDKVLVQYRDVWYKTTVQNFNPKTRRILVTYDDKPFRFKNSEKIQDFTRIRKIEEDREINGIFSIHA